MIVFTPQGCIALVMIEVFDAPMAANGDGDPLGFLMIAVLQVPCGGTPHPYGHGLASFQYELAHAVTSLVPAPKECSSSSIWRAISQSADD
jgi:hypothetical protein